MTKNENRDLQFNILMFVVIILGMVIAIIFCIKKQGYHFDEYYSYYSTNITGGMHIYSREWKDVQEIKDEFIIHPDEGLNFGLVKLNQSFDVHPPLYYYFVRVISWLTKGVFSKWQGLAINLFFYFICLLLLWKITDVFSKGNKWIDLFTLLLFVLSPGYLSTVTFIRMYVMLTAECFGVLLLHMVAIRDGKWSLWKVYVPSAVLAFAGFMTHYYFMIFMFFLAAFTCIYLVARKETRVKAFIYGGSVCAGMLAAVLYYPACLSHIFSGYRGKEATEAFADMSNTFDRIGFFVQILNDYTFSGMFYILALIILLMYVFYSYKRNGSQKESSVSKGETGSTVRYLLIFVTICYFLVVCKTGIMPSNPPEALRYECPAYGLIILIVVWGTFKIFEKVTGKIYIPLVLMCLATVFQIRGLCSDKVFFLYEDAPANVSWAADNGTSEIVYIYNPLNEWMVWNDSSELMEYNRIYYIDANDTASINEPSLMEMKEIYVYACRNENTEKILSNLVEENAGLSTYEKVSERLMIDVYRLH